MSLEFKGALAHPVLDAMMRAILAAQKDGVESKGLDPKHTPSSEVTVYATKS